MRLLDKLEKKLGKYSIHNLTLIIIVGQVLFYFAIMRDLINISDISISYDHILKGQIWRIFSFIFIPPTLNPVFAVFGWYLFYLMGNSLDHYWGTFHYNVYILISIILTNLVALVFGSVVSNVYLQSSVFLAFAFLYPDFQVRLFFIIPVKVKWLALLTWILYSWTILFGDIVSKLLIVASLTSFLLFFYKDLYFKIRYRRKKILNKFEKEIEKSKTVHKCAVCGITDKDDPYMDFRYCSQCQPEKCYCEDHIHNHGH